LLRRPSVKINPSIRSIWIDAPATADIPFDDNYTLTGNGRRVHAMYQNCPASTNFHRYFWKIDFRLIQEVKINGKRRQDDIGDHLGDFAIVQRCGMGGSHVAIGHVLLCVPQLSGAAMRRKSPPRKRGR
jgi:hypothetical protein